MPMFVLHVQSTVCQDVQFVDDLPVFCTVGPLHDLVTWYKINHIGPHVMQWEIQSKESHKSRLAFLCFGCPTSYTVSCGVVWLILLYVILP